MDDHVCNWIKRTQSGRFAKVDDLFQKYLKLINFCLLIFYYCTILTKNIISEQGFYVLTLRTDSNSIKCWKQYDSYSMSHTVYESFKKRIPDLSAISFSSPSISSINLRMSSLYFWNSEKLVSTESGHFHNIKIFYHKSCLINDIYVHENLRWKIFSWNFFPSQSFQVNFPTISSAKMALNLLGVLYYELFQQ